MKKLIVNTLGTAPLINLGNKLYRHYVPVFMLHRLTCDEIGIVGHHEPAFLQASLEYLRKHKFNFVTIDEVANAIITDRALPPKSVAFTLDDGYAEQVDISADIFSAFDCPATYYVSTGFVSGDLWLWNDKTEYLVEMCDERQLNELCQLYSNLKLAGKNKAEVSNLIIQDSTQKSLSEIESKICSVAMHIGLELPNKVPDKFAPTSWKKLREIEGKGMMVGAHSYSHPILSREDDESSDWEIKQSTLDVNRQLKKPSKVFCYPIGRVQDFSNREVASIRKLGYIAGTSSVSGSIDTRSKANLYQLPRFSFPDTKEDFIQYASWIESFKEQFRRSFRG